MRYTRRKIEKNRKAWIKLNGKTIEKKVREALDSQAVIIPGFFDIDKYKQQLTDEICTLIESFKLSGFNYEQSLKLTEVYCRQIVNCVLLDLTRMKNVE